MSNTLEGIRTERATPELMALTLVLAALLITTGPIGVGIWIGTALAWYGFDVPYAVAVGMVGLAAAPTYTLAVGPAAIAPAAYLLLVLAAGVRTGRPLPFGVAAAGTTIALLGGWWLLIAAGIDRLWVVGTVLLVVLGSAAYGIHRYERFAMGLLEAAPDRTANERQRASKDDSDETRGPASPTTSTQRDQ